MSDEIKEIEKVLLGEVGVLAKQDSSAATTTSAAGIAMSEAWIAQFREDKIQRRKLRKKITKWIIRMLYGELGFVALAVAFQGFGFFGFSLNEWMFGLFVNGVVLQTFFTVKIIVKHLFPEDKDS